MSFSNPEELRTHSMVKHKAHMIRKVKSQPQIT